jgi:hypothetical protein
MGPAQVGSTLGGQRRPNSPLQVSLHIHKSGLRRTLRYVRGGWWFTSWSKHTNLPCQSRFKVCLETLIHVWRTAGLCRVSGTLRSFFKGYKGVMMSEAGTLQEVRKGALKKIRTTGTGFAVCCMFCTPFPHASLLGQASVGDCSGEASNMLSRYGAEQPREVPTYLD